MFYLVFHSFFNFLGELFHFADRNFYSDWWNAPDSNVFWRKWNTPVHRWALRCVYKRRISYNYDQGVYRTWKPGIFRVWRIGTKTPEYSPNYPRISTIFISRFQISVLFKMLVRETRYFFSVWKVEENYVRFFFVARKLEKNKPINELKYN